jgi:hypothetical protein
MTFYCVQCTNNLGLRPVAPTTGFLASQYQHDKHVKHTIPNVSYPVQSLFDNSSLSYYQDTVLEGYEHGAIEVTSRGTDILFCPSKQSTIGYKQRYGAHVGRQDTIRIVKTGDSLRAHPFLNDSSDYSQYRCSACGNPLF